MSPAEWVCLDCDEEFSQTPTVQQHLAGCVECPRCGSANVEWLLEEAAAATAER
jgi:DNA-directed RNA polymerase subunit RPC12/RpoP